MRFAHGDPVAPLAITGVAPRRTNGEFLTGTEVTFLPSPQTFAIIEFDRKTLEHRLRELAFLNSGVTIILKDLRDAEPFEEMMRYEGGVEAFVRHLDKAKTPLLKDADRGARRARDACSSTWRCGGTTATTRTSCASPTTSRSATAAPTCRPSAAR